MTVESLAVSNLKSKKSFLNFYHFCQDVAEGFFLLLTQIALLYKVEVFYKNRHRIKACEKLLRSSLFKPQNEEEDA